VLPVDRGLIIAERHDSMTSQGYGIGGLSAPPTPSGIGKVAGGVVAGDPTSLEGGGQLPLASNAGARVIRWEPHPSHAAPRSVVGSDERGPPVKSSWRQVGREATERAKVIQSASSCWTEGVRRTLLASEVRKANGGWENRPRPPGTRHMLRSSPSRRCHRRVETRRRPWTSDRMVRSRSDRCGGKEMVLARVSNTQPKIVFWVLQLHSPLSNFFSEMGSARR
jgi:hypothetical protein